MDASPCVNVWSHDMLPSMERFAASLLVFGIITIIFSSVLYDYLKPIWSLFELGDMPVYGLLFIGMFCVGASYFLVDYKRQATGENKVGDGEINKGSSAANLTESSISQSVPVEVIQAAQKVQTVQRTKIHFEIIMQLQLEYGTKRFKTSDAIKVIEERINADASNTRFALHWGQTQGQIIKLGHGLYQCVERAQDIDSSILVENGQSSQDPNRTFHG